MQDRCDAQNRTMVGLEERCASLKSTIEQLKSALEKASATESELKSEIDLLQHNVREITIFSQNNEDKLKQVERQTLQSKINFLFEFYKLKHIFFYFSCTNNFPIRKMSVEYYPNA